MRSLQNALSEYFYYTRQERNAALTLCVLCLASFVVPDVMKFVMPPKPKFDFTEYRQLLAQANFPAVAASDPKPARTWESRNYDEEDEAKSPITLFPFDPNTATKEDFVRLGLSERTGNTILNYRSKGGKFYKREDLKKIYGLRLEDYERLEGWVKIPPKPEGKEKWSQYAENQPFEEKENTRPPAEFSKYSAKTAAPPVNIDINAATAEDWQKLRGIGAGYAKRIINFREKLGGFSSVQQVAETFGLPDSTFQQVKPYLQANGQVFRKIKINSVTQEELNMHPYLNNFQAKVLFNYRLQHGAFADLNSLKKAGVGFKDSDWARLEPYLSFD